MIYLSSSNSTHDVFCQLNEIEYSGRSQPKVLFLLKMSTKAASLDDRMSYLCASNKLYI